MKSPFWCHWSNDTKNSRRWRLTAGRFWIHRRTEDRRARFTCLTIEWNIPCGHCGWSVTFGGGDSGRNLGFTFAIPLLLTFYLNIENAFGKQLFEWDFDRGSDRQIHCYFHAWAFWYSIWVGTMASWSRSYPWCRWWRQGSFHFASLLGKQRYESITVRDNIPIVVAMPEGLYRGTAKFERCTWKRPLWFARTRLYTSVDIPKGIPHAGKGENSWDCGDDGLFGYSAEGHDIAKAAARGREIVMKSRKRYGNASDETIAEALA